MGTNPYETSGAAWAFQGKNPWYPRNNETCSASLTFKAHMSSIYKSLNIHTSRSNTGAKLARSEATYYADSQNA